MRLGGRVRHTEVTGGKKNPKQATHLQLGIKWDYSQICFMNVRMAAGILEMRRCKITNLRCCQLPLMTLVEQQEKFISFHRFSLRLDCLLAATESETLSFCTLER